jgi:hypothetical protein
METVREVEFRDGPRNVPAHLADMMIGLKTHTLTYEEAVEKANWKLASDHVEHAVDGIIQSHFRGGS